MPLSKLYAKPTPHDTKVDEESLTEQEWKDSCDINIMYKNAARGLNIRGGPEPQYGYDDLTQTYLDVRIEKERLERELKEVSQTHEFTEEELQHIPPDIQKKFGFKKKAQTKTAKKDDQTTKSDNVEPKLPESQQNAPE